MALPQCNKEAVELAVRHLLIALGLDAQAEAYRNTPQRVAKMFDTVLDGAFIAEPTPESMTAFTEVRCSGMVMVHHVPFYSWCAHHLVPMYGHFALAYIPDSRVLGLSKLVRIFRIGAKRPTTQEDITAEAVKRMMRVAECRGVACYVKAEHMCMTLRGVKSPGSFTTTTAFAGVFENEAELRARFMAEASK